MAMWEPWRGCHRYSEGCKYCYIHKGDARRGVDTEHIVLTGKLNAPMERYRRGPKAGEYKLQPGSMVYLCFSSDFLIQEADPWRDACWDIIRQRQDLHFLFLTKRILRFLDCIPGDWGDGYENVTVGCTIENQKRAEERLAFFDTLPIRHKTIICQPLLAPVDLSAHLKGIEEVVAGGESDRNARPMDYGWVLSLREQCQKAGVRFHFRQCGTHFIKDGVLYTINPYQQMSQARKANINL